TYLMGGANELSNRELLDRLLGMLNELAPGPVDYRGLVVSVADRPGHDERYAVDSSRAERELGWVRQVPFSTGLRSTVEWYLANGEWVNAIRRAKSALERLGSGAGRGATA